MAWFAGLRNRRALRRALKQRTLDIAQTKPWLASWNTSAGSINQELAPSLDVAVARSRGLWRNNDYLRRYRTLLLDNVLGHCGLTLQARVTKRDGTANTDVNARIEYAWRKFSVPGACDVTGQLSWADVEQQTLECLARDGEFLVRKVYGAGPHGLLLQVIDPTLLDSQLNVRLSDTVRIFMGVEIDAAGRPIAYHLRNNGRTEFETAHIADRVRVPASEIIHGFVAEEPGQVRGLPWATTAARRLWLVRDFEDSAAVASSNAAKRVGFFVSPTGEAPPGMADQIVSHVLDQAKAAGKILTPEEVQALVAVAEKHTTVNPGQYDTLPQGYDFRPFESEYPHVNHGEYVKACLRGASSGMGVSYVSLGNDLESVNYSSARVGILEEREFYKWVQARLIEKLHNNVAAAWMEVALLKLDILRPLSVRGIDFAVEAMTWQPRRWSGIDPVKEANAAETNLKLRLTSRRRLILERGEDPDEVFAEIEQEEARFGAVETTPAKPAEPAEPDADDEEPQPRAMLRAIAGA